MGASEVRTFLASARAEVDEALERFLPAPPDCPPLIGEAMRYSLFAGGKRLRPILTLAAADAVGRTVGSPSGAVRGLALPSACAVEMIHTYSLVHDDLPAMDNDTLRRGRPTLHVVYGDGIAVLAGDALQAEAFALLAREPAADDPVVCARKLRALGAIAAAAGAAGMVGGQTLDLQAAGQAPNHPAVLDADGLRGMHARKTGALIGAAAVSGAIMAGGLAAQVEAVGRYAADLGLAFQIVDDILDVEGDAAQLGKTAGKDAAGGKPTYPALFGLEGSRHMAAQCIQRARQALADARLSEGWLPAVAEWVVGRSN
ncbi:MAG: polyprenyl synthetase family protein [Acidobacteria bacterium]|nr:polyprenyl synthetase family protein [Acidobacteriota bacterium]